MQVEGTGGGPRAMRLPDYRDGSIVNLMQSILAGLGASGAGDDAHGHLADLGPEEVGDAGHVVLLVIDGLGRSQLESGPAPALRASLRGTMTSVFPSTTASAVTTFLTGLAPVEHAVTGWFMRTRELGGTGEAGSVIAPLPFTTRAGRTDLASLGVSPADVFIGPNVFERVRADCHAVQPAELVDSAYSRAHTRGAASRGFKGLDALVDSILGVVRHARRRTYVSAYWPMLDTLSHKFGAASSRARRHLAAIDTRFERLRAGLAGSGTLLVATADHGFIDTRPESRLDAASIPEFSKMLSQPLCGEPRIAYCYVEDARRADFEQHVGGALNGAARVVESASMIEAGWFGLADPHPRLSERVGDYTLVMRDDYAIRDRVAGEKRFRHIGVHGGASREEMHVPLVVVPPS